MASISAGNMSIDISIGYVFDNKIYYRVRCSWREQSIINPAILEDCMQKVGDEVGAIETWDHGQSWLVLSLRKLLDTNESISWNPVSPAVSLAVYSSDFFSLPLRRTPAPHAVHGAKFVEAERSARESLFGFLDKDQFEIVLCIDTLMFKYGYEVSCNGICFRMCAEREELEKFCTALEAELARARAEDDLHGGRR